MTTLNAWIYTAPTGNSLAELQHAINRLVNALHAAHRNEPKVMVGRNGDGWTLTNLHVNGKTQATAYADEKALKFALNRRLMRVRRLAGELREAS